MVTHTKYPVGQPLYWSIFFSLEQQLSDFGTHQNIWGALTKCASPGPTADLMEKFWGGPGVCFRSKLLCGLGEVIIPGASLGSPLLPAHDVHVCEALSLWRGGKVRTGTACGHLLLREVWSPVLRAGCPLLTQEVLRSRPGSLLPRLVS